VAEHPSEGFVFPSSQVSVPLMAPSPHTAVHTDGWPAQDQPDSTWQVAEHPSLGLAFPSSQTSSPLIRPSPHTVEQTDGSPVQV
jgi:hypothetical protein